MKQINITSTWIDLKVYTLVSILTENEEVRKYVLINGKPFSKEELDKLWKREAA